MNTESSPAQWESQLLPVARACELNSVVRCYAEVESTMDVARSVALENPAASQILVLTERQTRGRGRQGRTWTEAPGALFVTGVWRLNRPVNQLSGLSLVVGLCLAEWGQLLGAPLLVKWPNDLVTPQGKKAAGVLIEVVQGGSGATVFIGIGMNLIAAPGDVGHAVAFSELSSHYLTPPAAVSSFLAPLSAGIRQFEQDGFSRFRDRWMQHAAYRGQHFVVDLGTEQIEGRFDGVSDQGALLLATGSGIREVTAGHVTAII